MRRNRLQENLCEQARDLAAYLNTDVDPYDFGEWAIREWERRTGRPEGTAESYEDLSQDLSDAEKAEYEAWLRENVYDLIRGDEANAPAYLLFEHAEVLPPGTWLVHFSRNSFLSFNQGATLETLALSTWFKKKAAVSCDQNLDPEQGLYEVVWGFAMTPEDLRGGMIFTMAHGWGKHVMVFQSDCAVRAFHNGDGFWQVIFPLCSEYNVHRGTASGSEVIFETAEGEDRIFERMGEVVGAIEEGKLVPNVGGALAAEALAFAEVEGLDLTAKAAWVPTGPIETVEDVDPRAVGRIRARLDGRDTWPESVPLIVVASDPGEGYLLLDGHHRLAAALDLGWAEVPALVVSMDAFYAIQERFGFGRIDYIEHVLAGDPLIAENLRKGRGGKPKRRTRGFVRGGW